MKSLRPFGLPKFETPKHWGVPAKVMHLVKGEGEEKRIVGIKVTQHEQKPFIVPVVDVRSGDEARERISRMLKNSNGPQSKFFKQSYSHMGYSYNIKIKDDE